MLLLFFGGRYLAGLSLCPKTESRDETYARELKNGAIDEDFYKKLPKQEVCISSEYGYKLHGLWFSNNDSKNTIIICHGHTVNLNSAIRYMKIFYTRGFNVLIYDHRYHGESGGEYCTMGFYEKFDLKSWVTWVIGKTGENSIIGTHGESMGASTVLMHAAIDDRISFTISDCPFESVYEEFKYRLKVEYKLPPFPLLQIANLFTKIRTKTFYGNIAPIKVICDIKTPVLFIHGDNDNYVPCSHTIHLYQLKKGFKQLYIAKGAEHAKSFNVDKAEYEKVVHCFLRSAGILGKILPEDKKERKQEILVE